MSQRPKERENVVSLLNAAIDGINLAESLSSVTSAKAIFGTNILLTMIKVRFFPCEEMFQAHTQLGLDDRRTRLRRAQVILCQHLQSLRLGNKWEEAERPQLVCMQWDKPIDNVSWTSNVIVLVLLTTMLWIAGLSRKYKTRSPNKVDAMQFLNLFTRGTTRRRLRPGSLS